MAVFIIFITVILSCVMVRLWWRADRQAIEEENKRYCTEEGHHIYYDRKLIAALENERLKAESVTEEEK